MMIKIKDNDVILIFTVIPIIIIVIIAFVTGLSSPYPEPPKIISAITWLLIIIWLVCLFYLIFRFIVWVIKILYKILNILKK